MACVVWLPPEMQVQGKSLLVSPQVSSTFSQGTPSSSAETRWTSDTDSHAEIPDARLHVEASVRFDEQHAVEAIRSGEKRAHGHDAAHLRAGAPAALVFRSSHLKSSRPRSSASRMKQLDVVMPPLAPGPGGPATAAPDGALMRRIVT